MRRVQSESKQPGMQASRHCPDCGDLLPPDGRERCMTCRPVLSQHARDVGDVRRREREEIEAAERQIRNAQMLINKINRRLK
jgi:hypothetical protein